VVAPLVEVIVGSALEDSVVVVDPEECKRALVKLPVEKVDDDDAEELR